MCVHVSACLRTRSNVEVYHLEKQRTFSLRRWGKPNSKRASAPRAQKVIWHLTFSDHTCSRRQSNFTTERPKFKTMPEATNSVLFMIVCWLVGRLIYGFVGLFFIRLFPLEYLLRVFIPDMVLLVDLLVGWIFVGFFWCSFGFFSFGRGLQNQWVSFPTLLTPPTVSAHSSLHHIPELMRVSSVSSLWDSGQLASRLTLIEPLQNWFVIKGRQGNEESWTI